MIPLIIRNTLGLGDIASLTSIPRDIHLAYPHRFQIDMRTSCGELWQYNPHVSHVPDRASGLIDIEAHCPEVDRSNQAPVHLISAWHNYLGDKLGLNIPCSYFGGDIFLSEDEKNRDEIGKPYWVVVNGGKQDFPVKWPIASRVQGTVDALTDRTWVAVGMSSHVHKRTTGSHVIDMMDKTNLRDLCRLVFHARGVLCGVTGLLHLAAAMPQKPDHPRRKPVVVMAGGREPESWAGYPGCRWLGGTGGLRCCSGGGCWQSTVTGGDRPCHQPVVVDGGKVPRCMSDIGVEQIVQAVRSYDGWW